MSLMGISILIIYIALTAVYFVSKSIDFLLDWQEDKNKSRKDIEGIMKMMSDIDTWIGKTNTTLLNLQEDVARLKLQKKARDGLPDWLAPEDELTTKTRKKK